MPDIPPLSASTPPAPRRYPWYHWRRLGFNFLTVSILVHLFFAAGATYLVVQRVQQRKQSFASAPATNSASRAIEHKVQMQRKQQTMSAPMAVKRVTTTGTSRVSLPVVPTIASTDAAVVPVSMTGMGGIGNLPGAGSGGNGGGSGSGSGAPLNLFGMRAGTEGLTGTFYDYKMNQGYQPEKGAHDYPKLVRTVLPIDGPWHPEQPYPHYTSPIKLHARYLIFPGIRDTEAGAAFQSPRSGPGGWLAVYRGKFSSPNAGSFRFVSFGDNVMIVQIDNHMVYDGSDRNYIGLKREKLGSIGLTVGNKALTASDWIELKEGEVHDIAVAIGDEGGVFASGLFVQPKGMTFAQGAHGVPKLPVFMLGAPTGDDRKLLEPSLLPDCLRGPYFRDGSVASKGIFSH